MLDLSNIGQPTEVQCPVTGKTFNQDDSHRFGVGFSHYKIDPKRGLVRSYSQVFNTLHCVDRASAKKAIKQRIDAHGNIPFGTYDPAIHNPDESHITHANAQNLVEYNSDGIIPKNLLPTKCAVTGKPLTNEWYIPHVDDSTRGMTYQSILQESHPGASVESLTLAAGTMEDAQKLAYGIIDEIIEPHYNQKLIKG